MRAGRDLVQKRADAQAPFFAAYSPKASRAWSEADAITRGGEGVVCEETPRKEATLGQHERTQRARFEPS
jgi:hypothetical protein